MARIYPRKKGIFLCALALCYTSAQAEQSYDNLVQRARTGEYEPALDYLRKLSAPGSQMLADQLLISGWAGKDEEVIRLYELYGSTVLRDRMEVHATAARALRNQQQWPQALDAYAQAQRLAPSRFDFQIARVQTLADAGQAKQALMQAQGLLKKNPEDVEPRMLLGYVLARSGREYASLREYDRAHDQAGEQTDVQREYVFSLQRAGLAEQALAFAQERPGLLKPADIRRLEGDALAQKIQLAEFATRREDERFVIADQALAKAGVLLKQWQTLEPAQQDYLRVRIDRLGALHARMHMKELVQEYRQLQEEGISLPPYAQRWVASALLYERQPSESVQLYRQVIATQSPKDDLWMADHQGLFYALQESNQWEEAHKLTEQLVTATPAYRYTSESPVGKPNDAWLDAQFLQANSFLYQDDTSAAQAAYKRLSELAPGNTQLRTGKASVYRLRGWPRLAEQQLKIAENTSPRALELEIEQGMVALSLQEWVQLDVLAGDVIQRFPESLGAKRLDRLRQIHHMPELRISGYRGIKPEESVVGKSEMGVDALAYSAPLQDNWRLFAGGGFGSGEFEEGKARHRSVRGGVEWRARNHTVEAEISAHDYGQGEKLGLRVAGIHDVDDHWQYGWNAQRLSQDTPLRALNSDVSADSIGGYLRWRESERRAWRLAASSVHFSDSNQRWQLGLEGSQRLRTAARHSLDAGIETNLSHNSKGNDVPYFNPKRDASAVASLRFNHVLLQRYETNWSQQVQLDAGAYYQKSYGTDSIIQASYGQRLRFDERFDGGVLLSVSRRPYDGDQEKEYRLGFDLNYRF